MNELWDEADGFFYDRLRMPDGSIVPLRARSMVGLLPLFAATELDRSLWEQLPDFRVRARWFLDHHPQLARFQHHFPRGDRAEVISLVDGTRLRRVLARMLDEAEFLSPYGLRSLSRYHREHPLVVELDGRCRAPRLRAGGIAHRALRRQLELARADLVPAQFPRARVAPPSARVPRRSISPSSCRPARVCRRPSAKSPTSSSAGC